MLSFPTQVLEHVTDPAAYLHECYRIFKLVDGSFRPLMGIGLYHPVPRNLWRWTNEDLRRMVSEAGFGVEYDQGLMFGTNLTLAPAT